MDAATKQSVRDKMHTLYQVIIDREQSDFVQKKTKF